VPKRRRFAEPEHVEDVEAPAPRPEAEVERRSERREPAEELPESILRLQQAVGNQALSRALRERFALPGEPRGAEAAGASGMQQEALHVGVQNLIGSSPADQVSLFTAMADTLPPESQELLRHASEAVSQSSGGGGGGGKMNAQLLKTLAHARLGRMPPESGITNAPALVDRLCDGVAFAFQMWQLTAFFTNVIVQGPAAFMGQIQAAPLGPFVLVQAGASSGPEGEAAQAVAGALDDGMRQWQSQPKFPGLPLYPSFAALPMAHSPPTPNIPVPVTALMGGAVPPQLHAGGRATDPGAAMVADAVLGAITGGAFELWAASTMVVNMLGHGPVPNFAPPYVPVGQVVGGTVLPMPGVLQ
jgi:hypothetical protein